MKHFRVKKTVTKEEDRPRNVCTYRMIGGRMCGEGAISVMRSVPAFACAAHRATMSTMAEFHDKDLAARQVERFDREDENE